MVTAEQVKDAVQKAGLTFVENHDCSLCGEPVGYVIRGGEIFYRSGCGCSWAPDRLSSWQEAADSINMQERTGQWGDVAAKVAKTFGLELPPLEAAR